MATPCWDVSVYRLMNLPKPRGGIAISPFRDGHLLSMLCNPLGGCLWKPETWDISMCRYNTFRMTLLSVLLMGIVVCFLGATTMAANESLAQLFADYWNYRMERWPTSATYNGDHRFDDRLHDVSIAAYQQDEATIRGFLERLELIVNDAALSPDDELNAELFERELKDDLEQLGLRDYLMPVSQQSGPQMVLPELLNVHPFDTEKGCEDFIARLKAFPRLINQTISNMQNGVTEKLVPARVNVEKALPQFRSQVVDTVENHLLASAADQFGDSIPPARRDELRNELLAAIRDHVIPGYKRIAAYMEQDYLPNCRTDVGLHALPNGKERYRTEAQHYTTTDLTPEAITEIGKRELARVHEQMQAVMDQVGFDGTIPEFADSLRN
ncbi:MAG: DUF885 family protein, partial [candidate division Zixibacteria bacterium]|nr:DUF885 family protein [candidate division Zixibacteria bacterium]